MITFLPAILIGFILVALLDLRYREIPDVLTIPGMIAGIYLNCLSNSFDGLLLSLSGIMFGFLTIFFCGTMSMCLVGRPQIGGGDLKLMAMIGSLFGPLYVLLVFAIAPFLGTIFAVIFKKSVIPYGVFIVFASLLVFIFKGI